MRRISLVMLGCALACGTVITASPGIAQTATKNSKPAKKYDQNQCANEARKRIHVRGPEKPRMVDAAIRRCLENGPGAI